MSFWYTAASSSAGRRLFSLVRSSLNGRFCAGDVAGAGFVRLLAAVGIGRPHVDEHRPAVAQAGLQLAVIDREGVAGRGFRIRGGRHCRQLLIDGPLLGRPLGEAAVEDAPFGVAHARQAHADQRGVADRVAGHQNDRIAWLDA